MLTGFAELLAQRAAGSAVGAFTCYDLETAFGVMDACVSASAGAILLVSDAQYRTPRGRQFAAALAAAADRSEVPLCLQLDHCTSLDRLTEAVDQGFGAVMADGSRLEFAANAELVCAAAEIARARSAAVEAELGHVAGDEDVATATEAGALTDPAQAAELVERAGVDCLAVSIGNVHGTYRQPPRFDWARLEAIAAAVDVPLSLHGASGVSDSMVQQAIATGIAKINVNTELRAAYLARTGELIGSVASGARLAELHAGQSAAVATAVQAQLRAYEVVAS